MHIYTDENGAGRSFRFSGRQWWAAAILFIGYILVTQLSAFLAPGPAVFPLGSGIALGALFLEGIGLWPVVYIASLAGNVLRHSPLFSDIVFPIAQTLQAIAGAYLLRTFKVDPLFRRSRDIFFLLVTIVLVSVIAPSLGTLANIANNAVSSVQYPLAPWGAWYIGTVFCLLIITPFLLRWFSKPRFSRTWPEMIETLLIFALLIGIDYAIFVTNIAQIAGVSLIYLLLIPLFWIALRLRPRFVTLALLITSGFAIGNVLLRSDQLAATFGTALYETELFLIVLSSIFFIIVSLEEDRRLNNNLMRSQLATLENAVARISSESKAKNDFIAVLAHELRNPLAPIASAIDLLKLKGGEAEDIETLTMMEERMHIVRRLLDDLLDISRISEGKVALKKEHVDLESVIRRAVLSTAHYLQDRHQKLDLVFPAQKLIVEGDSVRIEQIFSNLLTNASKYSDGGDHIQLLVAKDRNMAQIIVRDQGIGIEADSLEHIFTPFHQLDQGRRSKKGLGIGLALVRSFVEMHNGSVEVASKGRGKGSEFTVRLPLSNEIDTPHAVKEPRSSESGAGHAGLQVLVVDDNDAAAWGIGKLLELRGCEIEYAYDGRQAIEKAAEMPFDVILLDVGLPDQSGYDVAKTLRARGFRGRLIALTGFSTEEARTQGRESGFEYYLIKPAGFAELKRVIPEIG